MEKSADWELGRPTSSRDRPAPMEESSWQISGKCKNEGTRYTKDSAFSAIKENRPNLVASCSGFTALGGGYTKERRPRLIFGHTKEFNLNSLVIRRAKRRSCSRRVVPACRERR